MEPTQKPTDAQLWAALREFNRPSKRLATREQVERLGVEEYRRNLLALLLMTAADYDRVCQGAMDDVQRAAAVPDEKDRLRQLWVAIRDLVVELADFWTMIVAASQRRVQEHSGETGSFTWEQLSAERREALIRQVFSESLLKEHYEPDWRRGTP